MSVVRPKKDRLKEQSEHPGQEKFKIFYKDPEKGRVTVRTFWAAGDAGAETELEIFRRKNALVCPDDAKEYFYGQSGGYIHDLGNGMEEEFDSMDDSMRRNRKEPLAERVADFFMPAVWWLRDVRCALKDFWYWFRHYDMRTNKSHQRFESWSLDSAVLDMLEFNIPLIMESKNGVPNEFCVMARKKLHEGEPDFDLDRSFRINPNPDDRTEMPVAEKLWKEELERMLLHIRLYRYYSGYGVVGPEDGPEYAEIARLYSRTLPYKPGTDRDIDFQKAHELTQREWNEIWKWMARYGQMLWT